MHVKRLWANLSMSGPTHGKGSLLRRRKCQYWTLALIGNCFYRLVVVTGMRLSLVLVTFDSGEGYTVKHLFNDLFVCTITLKVVGRFA